MPSTIPYDSSLVLGNLVSKSALDNAVKISALQAPADAAESEMNSLISLKRSVDMTIQEMIEMKIDVPDLIQESKDIGVNIQKAAVNFGKTKVKAEKHIQPLKAKMKEVNESLESPMDYNKSQLKQLPISSDSLKMNCQYFAYDKNSQSSASHAMTVASFVSESMDFFGEEQSSEAQASAQAQMNMQHARHSIAGTMVVSITCTHKNAQVYAPFILDADKSVKVWNNLYPKNKIDTTNPASIARIEATSNTLLDLSFDILSGATYGSSFVAMVHVLDTTTTTSSQAMESVAESMQETFDIGGWFAEGTGGFGVASTFSNSVENLLSQQNVTSHCTMITMGIIPSIKSNAVKMAVKSFADFDPAATMTNLATLQAATASQNTSVEASAAAARTGAQMIALKNATITSTLSGLADIDDGENKIIDTNSVMTALEDYVDKCIAGGDNMGVPINYYLKPISQSEVARAWMAKYYPNKFNQAGSADDSSTSSTSSTSSSTSSTSSDDSGDDDF